MKSFVRKYVLILISAFLFLDNQGFCYEVFTELETMPGNLAISKENRKFISIHPFADPEFKVMELVGKQLVPYPNKKISKSFSNVIGLRISKFGELWILDVKGKLLGWNIHQNKKIKEISMSSSAVAESFMQDFALDQKHNFIYIADMGRASLIGKSRPAIVSVNLENGKSKRFLEGHYSMDSDGSYINIDAKLVAIKGNNKKFVPPRLGLNPITITRNFKYVYYGAMNGVSVFKIPSRILREFTLSETEAEHEVIRVGNKAVSDGITIDTKNNLYVTDLNQHAIGVMKPRGDYKILIQDKTNINWPDGFSCGGDGFIYFTVNQLHLSPVLNRGKNEIKPPFKIMRFKPLAPCEVGR